VFTGSPCSLLDVVLPHGHARAKKNSWGKVTYHEPEFIEPQNPQSRETEKGEDEEDGLERTCPDLVMISVAYGPLIHLVLSRAAKVTFCECMLAVLYTYYSLSIRASEYICLTVSATGDEAGLVILPGPFN
jgi:hypothetical protein